jgi:hypothetical protein
MSFKKEENSKGVSWDECLFAEETKVVDLDTQSRGVGGCAPPFLGLASVSSPKQLLHNSFFSVILLMIHSIRLPTNCYTHKRIHDTAFTQVSRQFFLKNQPLEYIQPPTQELQLSTAHVVSNITISPNMDAQNWISI